MVVLFEVGDTIRLFDLGEEYQQLNSNEAHSHGFTIFYWYDKDRSMWAPDVYLKTDQVIGVFKDREKAIRMLALSTLDVQSTEPQEKK